MTAVVAEQETDGIERAELLFPAIRCGSEPCFRRIGPFRGFKDTSLEVGNDCPFCKSDILVSPTDADRKYRAPRYRTSQD